MNFFKTLICIGVLFTLNTSLAQLEFNSTQALSEYAFSKTNLQAQTNGYFFNYNLNYDSDFWEKLEETQRNNANYDISQILTIFDLMEKMDINNTHFEMDSILFPVMRSFYANNGYNNQNIPLFIFDLETSELIKEKQNLITNWQSENPFPEFLSTDFKAKDIYSSAVFVDTLVQNYIHFYWNDNTFITNKNRTVDKVEITINGETNVIEKNTPIDVSSYCNETKPLTKIGIRITFTDGKFKENTQNLYLKKTPVYAQNKSYTTVMTSQIGGNFHQFDAYENTVLQYQIQYGCTDQYSDGDNVLDKPFIIISGFGTYTDNWFINHSSIHDPWPTPFVDLYNGYNYNGLIDSLREANYDVIIARFLPPNESVIVNAELVEKLINKINIIKNNNGSYQENVVLGFSSGAICAKHALLQMENKHLTSNTPHHQCKLYASFEGEHGGANIPLAAQHLVDYAYDNHYGPWYSHNLVIYTLHYQLESHATRELLYYHHSQTGLNGNASQASHWERNYMLQNITNNNHLKNTHNPNFPSFCRNISIANGQNESAITSNGNSYSSSHEPFPSIEAKYLYKYTDTDDRKISARFNKNFNTAPFQVFLYKKKIGTGWYTLTQAKTNSNALVLDNAPGGAMFNTDNPILTILTELNTELPNTTNNTIISNKLQFCFTPTIFTHAIKNFNPLAHNRRLVYSFKEQGLMFQHINQINSINNASNTFGYPHLKYPNLHYTNYTPFDAVFTWNKNTEHVKSDELISSNGYFTTQPSNIHNYIQKFIVNEADIKNSYIQNKKYGFNANPNYEYKADVFSPHQIHIGQNVTQRTDFNVVEVQQNATVHCQAADFISIKPGFHAKAGSDFHAEIHYYNCNTTKNSTAINSNSNNIETIKQQIEQPKYNSKRKTIKVYPNPSNGKLTVELNSDNNFNYKIIDLSGKVIQRGKTFKQLNLYLQKGVYILFVEYDETKDTQKLIIY